MKNDALTKLLHDLQEACHATIAAVAFSATSADDDDELALQRCCSVLLLYYYCPFMGITSFVVLYVAMLNFDMPNCLASVVATKT